jgi:hypothetical protein
VALLAVLPLLLASLMLMPVQGQPAGPGRPPAAAATAAEAGAAGSPAGTLRLGTYLVSLDSIDLANNSFEAGFYLWTLWSGPEASNPSDSLELLNDIYNGDTYQFELLASKDVNGTAWRLYSVHSRFIHRWRLNTYPFDTHVLRMKIGFADPFQNAIQLEVDADNSAVSPELYLYGWRIGKGAIDLASDSSLSNFGDPSLPSGTTAVARAMATSVELARNARLHLVPDFLGYILAVGLCVMALLIARSRDDLILAAVVSAAGNYVFLAGVLPVGAMAGFIGSLQLIILLGILYVVGADEIIDHHLGEIAPSWARLLRLMVLPSYLLVTMVAIYLIIPSGVVAAS